MEHIKSFAFFVLGAIAVWIEPIIMNAVALFVIFIINFWFGWLADLSKGKKWDFKKAWDAIKQSCVFFTLATMMFTLGKLQGNEGEAQKMVALLIYVIIYFYSCNILKNLMIIFPDKSVAYNVVSFLYHAVTIEFVKKIPLLSDYLNKKQEYESK